MESFVAITIIVGVITLGIMNQLESIICVFKEKITNSEIKETVYINSFVIIRQILECHSERNINQNITNMVAVSEKVTIETIIAVMIMNKYLWLINKFPDYMTVVRMMVIIFIIPIPAMSV